VALLAIGFLAYQYPIQKSFATNAFEDYIVSQGTSLENIESKEIFKDYKQGGYFINVIYKDNPSLKYKYIYFPRGEMVCMVFDETNTQLDASDKKVKYPSLED